MQKGLYITGIVLAFLSGLALGAAFLSRDADSATTANDTTLSPDAASTPTVPVVGNAPSISVAAADPNAKTLPVGSPLPSDAECAAQVVATPEVVPENTPYNQTKGTAVSTYLSASLANGASYDERISGDYTGSTDEILQWGACKWGFDVDHVRAQAYAESSWFAGKLGDCGVPTQPDTGGDGGCSSVGILQVKSADIPATHPGLWPISWKSTALNVDYTLAIKRACFEGDEPWLADTGPYTAGDEWGCAGRWFSGSWLDQGANDYIATVKGVLSSRAWENPSGRGCPQWESNGYCNNNGLEFKIGQ